MNNVFNAAIQLGSIPSLEVVVRVKLKLYFSARVLKMRYPRPSNCDEFVLKSAGGSFVLLATCRVTPPKDEKRSTKSWSQEAKREAFHPPRSKSFRRGWRGRHVNTRNSSLFLCSPNFARHKAATAGVLCASAVCRRALGSHASVFPTKSTEDADHLSGGDVNNQGSSAPTTLTTASDEGIKKSRDGVHTLRSGYIW